MAVSGTMALSRATFVTGSGAVAAQRGNAVWGANYTYNSDGLQNDILLISEEFSNLSTSGAFATDAELLAVSGAITTDGSLFGPTISSGNLDNAILSDAVIDTALTPRTSGTAGETLGSQAVPFAASGLIMKTADGDSVMALYVLENGMVSGVAL